jgi:hypothetical protein
MRAGNEDILTAEEYSDEDLEALYYDAAKAEMLLDLHKVTGTTETSVIDEITDENTSVLQAALAHKQLAIFYRRADMGEGSASRRRLDYYERLYRADAADFGRMQRTSGAVVRSTLIRR